MADSERKSHGEKERMSDMERDSEEVTEFQDTKFMSRTAVIVEIT